MLGSAEKSFTRIALMVTTALTLGSQLTGCKSGSTDYGYPAWYGLYEKVCDLKPQPGCAYPVNNTNVFKKISQDGQNVYLPTWVQPDTRDVYTAYGSRLHEATPSWAIDTAEFARLESKIVDAAGAAFSKELVIPEDAGVRLARAANEWAHIGWTRARTIEDQNRFALEAFGVEMKLIENALIKAKAGDVTAMDPIIARVAVHWKANPKVTREILRKWYTDGAAVIF